MSAFMTATQSRALLHRSMQPRPSQITPELNAALIAETDEQIEVARHFATEMIEQRNYALAGYGFTEVTKMRRLSGYYAGKEGDDAAAAL